MPPQVQNLLHIPVYAGLAFLWRWALAARPAPATVVALVVTVGYGVFDEWYQSFIPGRFASLTDVLFNALGAGLGLLVFWWWRRGRESASVTPEPR